MVVSENFPFAISSAKFGPTRTDTFILSISFIMFDAVLSSVWFELDFWWYKLLKKHDKYDIDMRIPLNYPFTKKR